MKSGSLATLNSRPPKMRPTITEARMTTGKMKRLASHQKPLPAKLGSRPKSFQPSPPKSRSSSMTASGAMIHKS